MFRSTLLALTAVTLGACAPSTHTTAYRQVAPKTSPDKVEVFTEGRPERPYEELGVIEVSASELSNTHYGDLIALARKRAAEMGADAIIVTRDPAVRDQGFAYVPGGKPNQGRLIAGTSRKIETPRIQVSAILWRS
jgi:hypothetical protein